MVSSTYVIGKHLVVIRDLISTVAYDRTIMRSVEAG